MENKKKILEAVTGGLMVSCQALPHEPLHSSFIMGRLALAASMGGACGIRANTAQDILEIKNQVKLPVIGIVKKDYPDSQVYITPTMDEVEELVRVGCEIIAMDATGHKRPGGMELADFFRKVRDQYPDQLFMADIASFEEGEAAEALGFDLVGTTLCGYTQETKGTEIPNLELISKLSSRLSAPVVAEGGIHSPEDLGRVYEAGAYTAVVGGAITRPLEITRRFMEALQVQ